MRRGAVQLKKIEPPSVLRVTFSKRRNGLIKKAKELSILCDAEVAVIVFSASSNLTSFANPKTVDEIIERYKTHTHLGKTKALEKPPLNFNVVEEEIERLRKKCDEQDLIISQMEGKELENLSMEQLHLLEERMQNGLNLVRAQKREHDEKAIAELQNIREHKEKIIAELRHTVHLIEDKDQQNQEVDSFFHEVGVENVVHQESESSDSTLSANNANSETDDSY